MLSVLLLLLVHHTTNAISPSFVATKLVFSRAMSTKSNLPVFTKDSTEDDLTEDEKFNKAKTIASNNLKVVPITYAADVTTTETPYPDDIKSIDIKKSSFKDLSAPMCRNASTLTLLWDDKKNCATKANFYLCNSRSIKRPDYLDTKKCKLIATDIAKGAVLTMTASAELFFGLKENKLFGITSYIFVDAVGAGISTTTTASCKEKTATSLQTYVASLSDYDCDYYLNELKEATAYSETIFARRKAAPFNNFMLFVFVWLPLILGCLWAALEAFKRSKFDEEDKAYNTPYFSSKLANAPSVEVSNPSMGSFEVTVEVAKEMEGGIMQAPCPKCEESIVRPVNEEIWQCKHCGCHVTLSPLKDEFINVDDGEASAARSNFDTFQIGPIEYQNQKQIQLDKNSVNVTQTQNAATGTITVVGSNTDFGNTGNCNTGALIGGRATCGAYQYTQVLTGGQIHGSHGNDGQNGSNGHSGSSGSNGSRGRPGGNGGNGSNGSNGNSGSQGSAGQNGTTSQPLKFTVSPANKNTYDAITMKDAKSGSSNTITVGATGRIFLDAHGGNGGNGGHGGRGGKGGDGGHGGSGGDGESGRAGNKGGTGCDGSDGGNGGDGGRGGDGGHGGSGNNGANGCRGGDGLNSAPIQVTVTDPKLFMLFEYDYRAGVKVRCYICQSSPKFFRVT